MIAEKKKRIKDRDFLGFAKEQGGICCTCRWLAGDFVPAEELHHFGPKGMGQKSDDHLVARLCVPCHKKYQGRKRTAFISNGEYELYSAMLEDATALMSAYIVENSE